MTLLLRTIVLGLICCAALAHVRERYPEYALLLAGAFLLVVLTWFLGPLAQIVAMVHELGAMAEGQRHLSLVLRATSIAFLTTLGAAISRDADEEAIAAGIELAGRLLIVLMAAPLVYAIVDALLRFLSAAGGGWS